MTSRRNTIQKDLVRNTVYEMRRHVTANEVYEFIKEAYPTIGKGTVYRNLDILVEEGALRKVFLLLVIQSSLLGLVLNKDYIPLLSCCQ